MGVPCAVNANCDPLGVDPSRMCASTVPVMSFPMAPFGHGTQPLYAYETVAFVTISARTFVAPAKTTTAPIAKDKRMRFMVPPIWLLPRLVPGFTTGDRPAVAAG